MSSKYRCKEIEENLKGQRGCEWRRCIDKLAVFSSRHYFISKRRNISAD